VSRQLTYTVDTNWSSEDFAQRVAAQIATVEALVMAGALTL
jgi:hypothetical protein